MWSTAKILLFLSIVQLSFSRLQYRKGLAASPRVKCPEGQYNYKGVGFCFVCTPCAEFLYEQEKCSETSNTVCGWCGKEPNFAEISDTVLASYQTKCMMSRLEYVDMGKLKEEIQQEEENEESVEDSSSTEEFDNDYERNKPAVAAFQAWMDHIRQAEDRQYDSVFKIVDSVEEVSNSDSQSSEEEDPTYLVDETSAEDQIKQDENGIGEDSEQNMEDTVSDRVEAYLIQKSEKLTKVPLEDEIEIRPEGSIILSRDEVEASLKDLVELQPVNKEFSSDESNSEEDSNERDIQWDRWVDDEVKPLEEDTEMVEAEEISQYRQSKVYRIVNYDPVRGMETIEVGDLPEYLIEMRQREESERKYAQFRAILKVLVFVCGGCFIFNIIRLAMKRRAIRNQRFQGVPSDCPDYHMIIDASRYLEEQEKNRKAKHAEKHIHDNPVFDI